MSDKQRLFRIIHEPFEFEGEKFTIRQLKGRERDAMAKAAKDKDQGEQTKFLVAYFLGDANGDRVFGDDQLGEIGDIPHRLQELIIKKGNAYNFADAEEKKT